MTQQSACIRYRATSEIDGLVERYITYMESPNSKLDLDVLLAKMEKFVNESVDTFVLRPAEHVGLQPGYLRMIHSLSKLVEKSAMMLVNIVAKKMSVEDHRNAANYIKQVRLATEENGERVGDIAFPIGADFAELGWATHSLIKTLVPKIAEAQTIASAEYFSGIVGPGPYSDNYGMIPEAILALHAARSA